MAILGAFIGIDRFQDSRIRELFGCRRDAEALWSLFSDTIPEISAVLCTDTKATVEGIREAFDNSLGTAGPEDVVIVSLSTHGSPDHHLVAHDSIKDQLGTFIPMEELARRFKTTRAKAVLCVLDCCFSGGAPARVIEDHPIPRSLEFSMDGVAGKGRLLIAASNTNEPALEDPRTRHGLLTKAVMDSLRAQGPIISLAAAMEKVMAQVRSEAQRMGAVQTPILYGYIEGGLTLPALVPGPKFAKLFPETRGIQIRGAISELTAFGISPALIPAWEAEIGESLNALQLEAVNVCRVLDGESLFVVAPTSSGKTFIGEIAAARAIFDGRKAVFLLPYKALANEKFDQFNRVYGEKLGMRVIRCTGDYQDRISAFYQGKYDLALLTYEMFLNISLGKPASLAQIGLVVVDEAQFISDPSRGIVVELLLTHILSHTGKEVSPQLLALSAVTGELNHFPEWLRCKTLITKDRPVPLVEGVLDETGLYRYKDANGEVHTRQLLPRGSIVQRGQTRSSQDIIVPLVKSLLVQRDSEKVIVFRNQRGTAEGCAAYLARELGLPPATEALDSLSPHDMSNSSTRLRNCLAGGTAFHNSNLTREEREIVEKAFRARTAEVKVLGATTTVAAGINTPASAVIIAENNFKGKEERPFLVSEYKNMAGRAGRKGYQEDGKVFLLAESSAQSGFLFNKYVMGEPEAVRSSFEPDNIDTWIIRLLAQVVLVPREEIVSLLASTFGGYLAIRQDPGWADRVGHQLTQFVDQMLTLGLLEEEGLFIRLSLLGRACGRSSLSLRSSMKLVQIFRQRAGSPLAPEEIMVLLQCLSELDDGPNPLMRRGTLESRWPQELVRAYGRPLAQSLQANASDNFVFYGRCKRAMILRAWINGESMEDIERSFTPNQYQGRVSSGDVRQMADLTRFHLRSAFDILSILLLADASAADTYESLLKRLEVGIPDRLLDLLSLPIPLSRGEILALQRAGINSVSDFWAASPEFLSTLLGTSNVGLVERNRPRKEDKVSLL